MVLFDIGHCIELTVYWFVLLLMLSFIHFLLMLLLIISLHFCSRHCFWTHINIFIINQRFWCSFTMLLLFALLFVRMIIKNSLYYRHRSYPPIIDAFVKYMSKWLNEWKNIWTYDILAAEYQFVDIENSIWIDTYCKIFWIVFSSIY